MKDGLFFLNMIGAILACMLSSSSVCSSQNIAITEDKGKAYHIHIPSVAKKKGNRRDSDKNAVVMGSPEAWISMLESTYTNLDAITVNHEQSSNAARARKAYAQVLMSLILGSSYGSAERSVNPTLGAKRGEVQPLGHKRRNRGLDWTYLGLSMTGKLRMLNVENVIQMIVTKSIPGGYMETGVWRGGSSILARGIIRSFNEGQKRHSFVCDSFRGLPASRLGKDHTKWDNTPYLEVDEEQVINNFKNMGVLDDKVVFVKGFFNETMKPLSKQLPANSLAVLRLDGDMYESTVDVLYHMYDKISLGGYVIVDDWTNFPAQVACNDFFKSHQFQPKIIQIDGNSAYWKKEQETDIQYWRYEKREFR